VSIYTLKDRTIRMYKYDAFYGADNELGKNLAQSTQTSSNFFNRFFPSGVNPLNIVMNPFGVPTQALGLQTAEQYAIAKGYDILTFKAVESINISYKAAIAVEQGLIRSFIQPWYIEPAVIKISGTSYLGCFFDISNADKDIEKIYKFFNDRLCEGGTKAAPGDKKEVALDIVNNPVRTDRFVGHITSFDFEEKVDKPYLLTYNIEFVGKPDVDRIYEVAVNEAEKDKATVQKGD
jgi:hypothetical protein